MKIKLLKDHELGKANDVVEATAEQANYLIRCNVAVEQKELKQPYETKELKVKKETKSKTTKKK